MAKINILARNITIYSSTFGKENFLLIRIIITADIRGGGVVILAERTNGIMKSSSE